MAKLGIDISAHNGDLDLEKLVKDNGIDFVIIRVGFGYETVDKKFKRNVELCKSLGIPFGFYWYSYALNIADAKIEAESMLKLIEPYKDSYSYGVWFDMEDADNYKRNHGMPSNQTLRDICKTFCSIVEDAGYYTGIYASKSWLDNQLNGRELNRYDKWIALWPTSGGKERGLDVRPEEKDYEGIWQFTSEAWFNGSRFDANYAYKDYPARIRGGEIPQPTPKPVDNNVNVYYRVRTQKHGWLPEVKNLNGYAGWEGSPITDVAIGVDKGKIDYQVHVKGGGWLPKVSGYNIKDVVNGYAGNGKIIDAIKVYYYTPSDIRPFKKAKYSVNSYPWQYDTETGNGQDGYAGAYGAPITKLQIEIV